MKHVRVIGAGFSGTLAAYLLSKKGYSVTLVESNEHFGGLIRTLPHPRGDVETAANGFISSPLIEEVADEIGVKLVLASKLARKNRWLWIGSGPKKWPLGLFETLAFVARLIWGLLTGSMPPRAGETLEQWGTRTLGTPATQRLLATAMLGIYAAPISELSATLVVGRFFKKTRGPKQRPKLRGTVAPENGMGQWFEAMRAALQSRGVTIVRQSEAPLASSDEATFICTSAHEASRLLSRVAPELSSGLASIELLPIAVVTGFTQTPTTRMRGFGCLFHPEARFQSLGALWSSDIFPHRYSTDTRSERWILGGRSSTDTISLSDEDLIQGIQKDRRRLGLEGDLENLQVTRWPKGFPIYNLQLEHTLQALPQPPKNIVLCGNYLGSLGLTQIALRVQQTVEEFAP